jgi:hypothetical protein
MQVQSGGMEKYMDRTKKKLTIPLIPAPSMWPTVDPTATPAAVEAIYNSHLEMLAGERHYQHLFL